MKFKKSYVRATLVIIFLLYVGLAYAKTKLTYLECVSLNSKNETYIEIASDGLNLTQSFVMPYDVLDSISVQIGTFQKDNNSTWSFSIFDDSHNLIYQNEFNASLIEDNEYYKCKLNKRIRVQSGSKYFFSINSLDASDISKLAFFVSDGCALDGETLYFNENKVNGTLCFKVYGGDVDYWWSVFVIIGVLYLLLLVARMNWVDIHGGDAKSDMFVQGMIVGIVSFLLLCTFAANGSFTDENDNIRGGMIIANGGVLYRDYVTQHTPVMYYLCSIFAKLGAGSIEQFRLAYYLLEAFTWCCLYIRHSKYFGNVKMFFLPILEIVCITSVASPHGHQILGDRLQGLLFVILMIEFIRYYNNKHLEWGRCIIISICIWGSIGSAFVSVYSLFCLALIVIFLEISYWKSSGKISFSGIYRRYYKFIISIIVPFALTAIYFKINRSLEKAFDQFYTFNRIVYPKYINGLGDKLVQPFINGIQNFFGIIADSFDSVMASTASNETILQLTIIVTATIFLIKLFEKETIISISLFSMMVFSATRGYGFHGMAAWYLAIMIIGLYYDLIEIILCRIGKPIMGMFSIVILSSYFITVGNNLLYENNSISDLESKVIELTDDDDNMDIFLDAYSCDSLYFFYKNRKPVNSVVYMFPWYMDWYEKDNIKELLEKKPNIVIYNEDREIWGYTHYSVAFDTELMNNYTRLGDEGWSSIVWVKK